MEYCIAGTEGCGGEWVGITCHNAIKQNRMPAPGEANFLTLPRISDMFGSLCALEIPLIAQRIAFMELFAIPRGKRSGTMGYLSKIMESLPKSMDDLQLIS